MRIRCVLAVAVLLAFAGGSLRAQTVTGTILGTVLDASGAAIPNADITVTNQDTGVARTTTASAAGLFNVPSLVAGKYTVEAKSQGFAPAQVKDIVVNVGTETRADLRLQVGAATQAVTVTESIPTVETTNSEVSQVMDQDLIKAIPLNARDLQQLVQVQPGVTMIYGGSYGRTLSVGGDRYTNNRFLQEGIDMTTTFRQSPVSLASNVLMGADAVKEFKVISENPPVEYGEESGGVINTIFKSGTNNLHGTLFESYRDSALDARNFFDRYQGGGVPPLQRHQFGASLGGPIRKDKTFFFANYEGFHADTSQSFTAQLPDNSARGTGIQVPCSPTSGLAGTTQQVACPVGTATGTMVDLGALPCGTATGNPACGANPLGTPINTAVSPAIYNAFFGGFSGTPLLPTCSTEVVSGGQKVGLCNLSTNPDSAVRENYGLIKLDHTLTSKNSLNGTYNIDRSTSYVVSQPTITADDIYFSRQTGSVQDTYIVSSNVVNTLRFGVNRMYYAGNMDLAIGANNISKIDPNIFVPPVPTIVSPRSPFPVFPQITAGSGATAMATLGATAQPGSNFTPRYLGYTSANLDEAVNYLRNKHAMQFGFQIHRWIDNNENYQSNPRGSFSFSSVSSFLAGGPTSSFSWAIPNYTVPAGTPICPTAATCNGATTAAANYNGTIARGFRLMAFGVYGEDTYKIKQNLTVTYGLRWEYNPGPQEEHNRLSNLWGPGDPPSCSPYNCSAANIGFPWYNPRKDNFAPRAGFNWDPFKKGTTSVRGSAGIFFNEIADSYWYPGPAFQYPFTPSIAVNSNNSVVACVNNCGTAKVLGVSFPFINIGAPGTATASNNVLNQYLVSLPAVSVPGCSYTGCTLPTQLQSFGEVESPWFKTPTKYAFNFAIQQQLPESLTVEVAYVGSQSRHLGRDESFQDYFPTAIETPGQAPTFNGAPITYAPTAACVTPTTPIQSTNPSAPCYFGTAPVNPNCVTPGSITCYYWAGSGLANANIIGTGASGVADGTSPYANLCAVSGAVNKGVLTNCYNNPYWSSSITGITPDANAFYNALQVILERRVQSGLLARFNYTFAKCITDSSFEQPTGVQNGGSAAWPLSYQADAARGPCAFVSTHAVNLTLSYSTHWGNSLSRVPKAVLADWEVTSQTTVSSGLPFTITTGSDIARYTSTVGAGNDRLNWAAPGSQAVSTSYPACANPSPTGALNPNWRSNVTTQGYLNPNCFALPPAGYLGDIGNMAFTGPGIFSTDISLRKTIKISENKSFVFSADMFNAFNRANFPPPTAAAAYGVSTSGVGSVGAANATLAQDNGVGVYFPTVTTSRQFQLNGRFVF